MFGDSAATPIGRSGNGPMPAELELRRPLLALRRRLAVEDRAHDLRVLAHLASPACRSLAVPALDDRPVRDADAEQHAPAGERRRSSRPSCAIVAGVRE